MHKQSAAERGVYSKQELLEAFYLLLLAPLTILIVYLVNAIDSKSTSVVSKM